MFKNQTKSTSAFTLLEILLVVGIIAILAGIVILAINPSKMLANTRNTQRKANLSEINKALYQYYIDNSRYPTSVSSGPAEICNTGASSTPTGINCVGLADLSALVPTYLTAIPTDPQSTASSTKYRVMKDSSNRVVLEAPQAELDTTVVVGVTDCGLSFIDTRDSKRYSTVKIGNQCWMQQNLNVGTRVNNSVNQGVSTTSIQKYCYDDLESNCDIYGGLYQWNQAMGSSTVAGVQGICPTGWHIPTHDNWTTLERAVCTSSTCATDFPYDITTFYWRGTNEAYTLASASGFKAQWGGYRYSNGVNYDIGEFTYLWTSLQYSATASWNRYFAPGSGNINRDTDQNGITKMFGLSVRCLKD